MRILGIDPGLNGGLAVLQDGNPIACIKMPTNANSVDVCAIQEFIIENAPERAIIEAQHVRGRQGGGITIGANFGRLTATLDLCGIPFDVVDPKDWQSYAGFSNGNTKEQSTFACYALGLPVPMTSNRKDASPHDGIADAWLIASYGLVMV